MNDPALPKDAPSPLSAGDRNKVESAVRLKWMFTLCVVAILVVFSGSIYFGVSSIFQWLTPSIQRDIQHKAQRAVLELVQTGQLGIVTHDQDAVLAAVSDYLKDSDVTALKVVDSEGKTLFARGQLPQAADLVQRGAAQAHDLGAVYGAWAPSSIEGLEVGRVLLTVSKARLQAGLELRNDILMIAACVGVVALLLSLAFVQLHIGPILRVTVEAFARLEETTKAALEASRLKSQFLANMSHEIRTPMNGIVGVIDLLNRSGLTSRQQRYTQTIEGSARTLLTIIDDVLDFSKLEADKVVLRNETFDVQQLAQDIVELLAPRAHSKELELILNVTASVPGSIYGDVDRLRQVLTNLIGNAIKFTDTGHVVLRLDASGDKDALRMKFAVQDTGIGIAPEDQRQLFSMFSQVDGSLTRRHGGTGLGLAISKRLVEAMGGTIVIDSELGHGSTFHFEVPTRAAVSQSSLSYAPRAERVIVVARDSAQQDSIAALLASWALRVQAVADVTSAAETITEAIDDTFSLAVVDGCFDLNDNATRELFHLCAAEGISVVRLLATGQTGDGREAERRHVCLTKPVRTSELYNGVVTLLEGGGGTPSGYAPSLHSTVDDAPEHARALVLVVDDNEVNRAVATELLSDLGYPSETACNGLEAIEKARTGNFGAILMDCQMPELDGYEATKRIRALDGDVAKLPIIALTAHALAGDRDRVLAAGMNDYVTKPVRGRTLERALARWLGDSLSTQPQSATTKPTSIEPLSAKPTSSPPPSAALTSPPFEASTLDASDAANWALDPTVRCSTKVVGLFLDAAPGQLADVHDAVQRADTEALRRAAHKLKGSCATLGAIALSEVAATVEHAASEGRIEHTEVTRLRPGLEVVSTLLREQQARRAAEGAR